MNSGTKQSTLWPQHAVNCERNEGVYRTLATLYMQEGVGVHSNTLSLNLSRSELCLLPDLKSTLTQFLSLQA